MQKSFIFTAKIGSGKQSIFVFDHESGCFYKKVIIIDKNEKLFQVQKAANDAKEVEEPQ